MESVFFSLIKILTFLPVFLFLSILVFYVPGFLIISRSGKKLREDEKIALSFGLGLVLFLVIAIFTSLIKARFLSPIFFLLINIYAFQKFKVKIFFPFLKLAKQKLLIAFLLFGTLAEGFINFPSSFPFKNGHLYWSSQGHDGLWHIAVIEAIKKNFPANNPLYAGAKLFNYHYFVDVIMAEFNRIFPFFSSLDLYFRYFSFLISFLMGLAAYSFLTTWRKNKTIGLLGIFFTYFVGSFGYLVLAIQGRGFFGGETIFWAAQGNTIIGNPPHAVCYFLLPTFFLALYHYFKRGNNFLFLACFLLGGFLLGFKVSAAFVLLAGLAAASFFSFWLKKRNGFILLTILLGVSNFTIFKLITKGGESLLMFLPWWFIRTMIVVPDRVNWLDLELRRQFYLARGGIRALLRIIQFETTAFLIFLVGNLGTRIIGFSEIARIFWKRTVFKNPMVTSLFFTMLTGFLMPIFFVQRGVTYNLIQFMQYFLLFFGFFAAITTYRFLSGAKPKSKKVLILLIIIALSIPTVIGNFLDFYGKNPLAIVSNQEIEALDYLKMVTTDNDIILTRPFNPYSRGLYERQPWPIYAWESTAYVSAYTTRQTYYTDEGQIRILGINTEERLKAMNDFFDEKISLEKKGEFLRSEKITFLYLRKEELDSEQAEGYASLGLEKIFSNDEAVVYRLSDES